MNVYSIVHILHEHGWPEKDIDGTRARPPQTQQAQYHYANPSYPLGGTCFCLPPPPLIATSMYQYKPFLPPQLAKQTAHFNPSETDPL